MDIALPPLPYPYHGLEPHISRTTLAVHHGKHHRAYVEKLKALAQPLRLAEQPLESIIKLTADQDSHRAIFNNAAQAWNHAFYWRCLKPNGGGPPDGEIGRRIDAEFRGYDAFAAQFAAAAVEHFGSGWVWLVLDGTTLKITQTVNADTPLVHRHVPLLTIDVWEHAYYLDYRNRRADYVSAVIEHLINWDFVNQNLRRQRSAASALDRVAG